jgi:MFS family permease
MALYLFAAAMVGFALDGGVYSVLLNLFLVRLGYGPEQIGVVNSIGTLTFALASLPSGALGERLGVRPMLLLGLGMMLVGGSVLPAAVGIPEAWRLAWLIGSSVLLYLGLALFFVNTAPFVMELVDAHQRSQVFSLQTALMSLAAFVGSLTGGLLPPAIAALLGVTLERPQPYSYSLVVAGLAMIPAIVAIQATGRRQTAEGRGQRAEDRRLLHDLLGVPDKQPSGAQPTDLEHDPSTLNAQRGGFLRLMLAVAGVRMLQVAGIASTNTFFNVYLDQELLVPTAQVGLILAVGRLLAVPAALTTSALTARFGNRTVVLWTTVITAMSILPIALVPHWTAAALSFVLVVGTSWIRYAASLVYFLELAPPRRRALVSGVMEMSAGLCFTALAFGGGYVITWLGYRTLFLTGAAVTLLSAVLFWAAFRDTRHGRG